MAAMVEMHSSAQVLIFGHNFRSRNRQKHNAFSEPPELTWRRFAARLTKSSATDLAHNGGAKIDRRPDPAAIQAT
jgi:hypothetical protein